LGAHLQQKIICPLELIVETGLAILGAKDDVEGDFAQQLGRGADDDRTDVGSESRFQRWCFLNFMTLGRCPRLGMTGRHWRNTIRGPAPGSPPRTRPVADS
jgi:hypothetical protein